MSRLSNLSRFVFCVLFLCCYFSSTSLIAGDDDKKKIKKETPYPEASDETPYPEYFLDFKKGTLTDVLQLAETSQKSLFVHTTSKSCSACDHLATNLYTDKKVGDFYNQNFISYIMDVDDVENVNFARMHDLGSRPMVIFFNSKGKILGKEDEIVDANQLIEAGSNAVHLPLRTSENRVNLENMHDKYNMNYRDPEFLYNYAYTLKALEEPYNSIVNEYIRTQQDTDMKNGKNRKFLYDFADNLENSAIDYFIRDAGYFKTILGGKINDRLKSAIYNSIQTAIKERDMALFKKAKKVLEVCNLPNMKEFIFLIESQYYEGTRSWKEYIKITSEYLEGYNISDPYQLNLVAHNYAHYVKAKNKSAMKNAIKWTKESISIDPQYYNNLTLALLYYKTEEFKLSKRAADEAIRIAEIRNRYNKENNINKFIDIGKARRLIDKLRSRGLLNKK